MQAIIFTAEVIVAIAIAVIYIRSRIPQETIRQQGELISTLKDRLDAIDAENKLLHVQHTDNEKAIAKLEGQIKVYKELPLQDIARSLKALEKLPAEFDKISKKHSEVTINAVRNVKHQNVENQTVKNKHVENVN